MKTTLIQLPTVALELHGYSENPMYLGNIYNRIMPPSLPRVASVFQREGHDVNILDLRIAEPERQEIYKEIDYEGYKILAKRVGAPFSYADDAIKESDIIGISSHFTFESNVVKDFIKYTKTINSSVKILVGGADASIRPNDYISFGADEVFQGHLNPEIWTKPSFELLDNIERYIDSHDGPVPEGVSSPVGFIYFTTGCLRDCDFCDQDPRYGYADMDLETSVSMLKHYKKNGIRTVNEISDNLLLQVVNERRREKLIDLFTEMKNMEFAWEFPNGLEIGMLARYGKLDHELIDALFYRNLNSDTNNIIGAYRLYFPIETFDKRENYGKLKDIEIQNEIIRELVSRQIPQINFGTIIFPDADEDTFRKIKEGYTQIKEIVKKDGKDKTKTLYGIFNMIPLGRYRGMKTKYPIYKFPELCNFYTPAYDGINFSAKELFEKRLELTKEIDPANYASMMNGKYSYA